MVVIVIAVLGFAIGFGRTLLLQANVPAKVVQERLGHKRIQITLDTYAHVLPAMQREAALCLSGILAI